MLTTPLRVSTSIFRALRSGSFNSPALTEAVIAMSSLSRAKVSFTRSADCFAPSTLSSTAVRA
jgi:hypothetical protein